MKNLILLIPALLIALVGCSSPSSSSGGMENQKLFVGGAPYRGTFSNNRDDDSGEITFSLNQLESDTENTASVEGIVSITGSDCLLSGTTSGTLNGSNLSLTVEAGAGTIVFSLRVTNTTLQGEYTVTGDDCSNGTGTGSVTTTR